MLITLPNAIGDAPQNMAVDAALLQSAPPAGAIFRHYGWTEPALTFGYTQTYDQVRETAPEGVALVRRSTGGGIVDHRNDWTYALVLGPDLPATRIPATELYTNIHRALAQALAAQSVPTALAPCPRKCATPPGSPPPALRSQLSALNFEAQRRPSVAQRAKEGPSHCFTTPAADDVIRPDGRKIAGAALKRNRHGLLLQGSVDRAALPGPLDYAALQSAFARQLADALDLPLGEVGDLRPFFPAATIAAERRRFAGDGWNQKR